MTRFSSLRVRLVGTVLVAVVVAWILMYVLDLPRMGFVIGLAALAAAWFGGERFVLRQVNIILKATRKLRSGELSVRTNLNREPGELGELARAFDTMADALEHRIGSQENNESTLHNRAMQQTIVAALGQFAISSRDISALFNQAVMMISQTMEIEYCGVLELSKDGKTLLLCAGVGWKDDSVGKIQIETDPQVHDGFTLVSGEPVVVKDFNKSPNPPRSAFLVDHGVISGVSVAIGARSKTFGVLGIYSARIREYTSDDVHFLMSIGTVLAMAIERKTSEAESQKLAVFAQLNPNPAMELDAEGSISYFNDAALKLSLAIGHSHPRSILPGNTPEIVRECLSTLRSRMDFTTRNGNRDLSWSFHPMVGTSIVHCYVEDITDRLSLEAQLRQSQKMESIGQLAAGVAHDFNNMLTVIQGHAGILLAKKDLPQTYADSIQSIYFAAERAGGLTRQLLMFSRKNIMQGKALDLRELITQLNKMLKRLLGETISLQFQPPAEIPVVHGDAGMIEQVLMNLAVNARDAMPKSGILTISLDALSFDDTTSTQFPEARPGRFVRIRVADNGSGMDSATMRRIFEPFFTTKEPGKGTGLGLATVYGIVKQHEGWIVVDSEVGKGTTFSIFLPAGDQPASTARIESSPTAPVLGGNETILLVEDELVLRDMALVILHDCGYRVLEAATGVEAMDIWKRHHNTIDLLLTDMVMPEGISGIELAERVIAEKPDLHVIFTSGYSVSEMDTGLIRSGRGAFLQKPYTRNTIAKAVRDCLDKKTDPTQK